MSRTIRTNSLSDTRLETHGSSWSWTTRWSLKYWQKWSFQYYDDPNRPCSQYLNRKSRLLIRKPPSSRNRSDDTWWDVDVANARSRLNRWTPRNSSRTSCRNWDRSTRKYRSFFRGELRMFLLRYLEADDSIPCSNLAKRYKSCFLCTNPEGISSETNWKRWNTSFQSFHTSLGKKLQHYYTKNYLVYSPTRPKHRARISWCSWALI